MPHRGWIKIHRKISDNPIWNDKPFCKGHAWTDLLTITNHKDGFIKIKNGENINIKRGECGYSELKLSEKWGWSRGKVKRFLTLLCKQEMIQQTIVHKHSIVKVLSYDEYQDSTTNDTTNDTTNRQQTVQQTDTNKNDKKEKNDKEDKKTKAKKACQDMLKDEKKKLAERSNKTQFEEFWEIYAYKKGIGKAEAAFKKALKLVKFDKIIAGARQYVKNRKDDQDFWKHPATWLNQQCWGDEYKISAVNTGDKPLSEQEIKNLRYTKAIHKVAKKLGVNPDRLTKEQLKQIII